MSSTGRLLAEMMMIVRKQKKLSPSSLEVRRIGLRVTSLIFRVILNKPFHLISIMWDCIKKVTSPPSWVFRYVGYTMTSHSLPCIWFNLFVDFQNWLNFLSVWCFAIMSAISNLELRHFMFRFILSKPFHLISILWEYIKKITSPTSRVFRHVRFRMMSHSLPCVWVNLFVDFQKNNGEITCNLRPTLKVAFHMETY